MTSYAQCTHCQTKFKAKSDLHGKSVRCPKCKKIFEVNLTEDAPSSQERAAHGSADNLSKSKVVSGSKAKGLADASKGASKKKPSKKPASKDRPKWAGEPETSKQATKSDPAKSLHKAAPGKESPILRSRRTLSEVILPGDRHVPAMEVPWGAPCNPPKDFLKEQSGGKVSMEPTGTTTTEYKPLISPDEKEIRIEPQLPTEDSPMVESESVELGFGKPSELEDPDTLIAGVSEQTVDEPRPQSGDAGFHRSAAEPVIQGNFTDEVVTSDNDGGYYRPALPGQNESIVMLAPDLLKRAMIAAEMALGRGPSFDELDAVEGSQYIEQIRIVLADVEEFGDSDNRGLPQSTKLIMAGVGVVFGIVLLCLVGFAIVTISSTLGGNTLGGNSPAKADTQFSYVTPNTSSVPMDARGPAKLVSVSFPTNFVSIPKIERPWLQTTIAGYRLVRPTEAYVMMYSSSIPGQPPQGSDMPSKAQLEAFGLQGFLDQNSYLVKTRKLTLDNYPVIEYEFSADILRSQAGKSRVILLFTQQRMFLFMWAGRSSSSEVDKFFQSIAVKGNHLPSAG